MNATAPRKTRKTTKKQERRASLQTIGNARVLWLTTDKSTTAYRLEAIPSQIGGQAFRLEKADQGNGQPEVYHVLINGQFSSCDCPGHSFRNKCKHLDGVNALIAAGRLPKSETKLADSAVPVPEEEETIILTEQPPQPADERDNYCPTCGCHYREHIAGFCPR